MWHLLPRRPRVHCAPALLFRRCVDQSFLPLPNLHFFTDGGGPGVHG